MVIELKIRQIGNRVGVVLPKKALDHLNASPGDTIVLTDAPDGSFQLKSRSPGFIRKRRIVDDLSSRYHNALAKLAR